MEVLTDRDPSTRAGSRPEGGTGLIMRLLNPGDPLPVGFISIVFYRRPSDQLPLIIQCILPDRGPDS